MDIKGSFRDCAKTISILAYFPQFQPMVELRFYEGAAATFGFNNRSRTRIMGLMGLPMAPPPIEQLCSEEWEEGLLRAGGTFFQDTAHIIAPHRDPNPTFSSRAEKGQTKQDQNAGI